MVKKFKVLFSHLHVAHTVFTSSKGGGGGGGGGPPMPPPRIRACLARGINVEMTVFTWLNNSNCKFCNLMDSGELSLYRYESDQRCGRKGSRLRG